MSEFKPEPDFTPTNDKPCPKCGGPTIPPYTGTDGYRYEGWYCEACGVRHDDEGSEML